MNGKNAKQRILRKHSPVWRINHVRGEFWRGPVETCRLQLWGAKAPTNFNVTRLTKQDAYNMYRMDTRAARGKLQKFASLSRIHTSDSRSAT